LLSSWQFLLPLENNNYEQISIMRLLTAIFLLVSLGTFAQQYPFPQNRTYEYGFSVSNITSTDVQKEYNSWKKDYYVECGTDEARIEKLSGSKSTTVSEGIGYGMLITVYMGDKDAFDKLWQYYKNRMDEFGLMHWEFVDCSTTPISSYAATDADLDATMALLVASMQWPNDQQLVVDVDTMLSKMKKYEFATDEKTNRIYMMSGDYSGNKYCTNPSYYSPGYYEVFAKFLETHYSEKTEDIAFWKKAAEDAYFLLLNNQNEHTGLVSAWAKFNGELASSACRYDATGGGTAQSYQYDACRTPWRVAIDYLWWGRPEAKVFLSKIVNFIKTPRSDQGGWYGAGGINAIKDGYEHNGEAWGGVATAPFVGSFALCGMATSQEDTDTFMEAFNKVVSVNYFNSTVSLLYKLLATGNFWNPFEQSGCSYPQMSPDFTLCGIDDADITINNYDSNNTYTWYADKEALSFTGDKISTDTAGYFSVMLENGNCKTYATVIASDIIPALVIPTPEKQCSEPNIELSLGDMFTDQFFYSWSYTGIDIPLADTKAITANQKGLYEVTVNTDDCEARSLKVYLSTDIPEFEKPIYGTDPGKPVTLKAKKATDVEWFSDAEGKNSLGTDTELEVSPTETTSYYMKDNDSDCAMAEVIVYMNSDCGDSDNDGVSDCTDECPDDKNKTEPGECGCGKTEDCTITDAVQQVQDENAIITIAPTVTAGSFSLTGKIDAIVTVYNCSNMLVETISLAEGTTQLIGGAYARGSYLLVATSGETLQNFIIVKK